MEWLLSLKSGGYEEFGGLKNVKILQKSYLFCVFLKLFVKMFRKPEIAFTFFSSTRLPKLSMTLNTLQQHSKTDSLFLFQPLTVFFRSVLEVFGSDPAAINASTTTFRRIGTVAPSCGPSLESFNTGVRKRCPRSRRSAFARTIFATALRHQLLIHFCCF